MEFEQDPLPVIDERWVMEFVNFGIAEIESRLKKQAAFDEWLRKQEEDL